MSLPVTASSASRALKCGASHALPSAIESGAYADRGNELHEFMDLCCHGRRDEALETFKDSDDIAEWSKVNVKFFLANISHIATEVAFAVNVFTGEARYLGHHLGRDYPRHTLDGDGWICGSEDYVGMVTTETGTLPVVSDWKSADNVGDVSSNLQVGFFAYCIHYLLGAPRVQGRISYTRAPGSIESYVFDDDKFDFDRILVDLKQAYLNVEKAKEIVAAGQMPTVYPGDQCKYCAASHGCPKWTGLVRAFAGEVVDLDIEQWAASLTIDKIAEIYPKFKQMKTYFEDMDKALKAYVEATPVPLPNGKVLKMVPQSREYINGKKVLRLARVYGASDEELAECV